MCIRDSHCRRQRVRNLRCTLDRHVGLLPLPPCRGGPEPGALRRMTDPTPWPKRIGALTLFVEDLAAAKQFYGDVFGLPVLMEDPESVVFSFGNTVVNLLVSSAADELIEPATVGGRDAGARAQ